MVVTILGSTSDLLSTIIESDPTINLSITIIVILNYYVIFLSLVSSKKIKVNYEHNNESYSILSVRFLLQVPVPYSSFVLKIQPVRFNLSTN